MTGPLDAVHAAEREFYDAHAAGLEPSRMPPRPPDAYEASILDALGPLSGLHVLEVGCGAGDVTLELVRRGARVTALDLSPGLASVTRARLARFAPDAEADVRVVALEDTGLPGEAFDRVAGKWILHHADVPRAAAEVARVLRPGGSAVFFENHDRNPVLRFARRRLMGVPGVARYGTEDERPLDERDMEVLRAAFAAVEASYPSLYLFELFSRQLLRHRLHRPLSALDAWLWRRVPRLRPYGYHVLLTLRKR